MDLAIDVTALLAACALACAAYGYSRRLRGAEAACRAASGVGAHYASIVQHSRNAIVAADLGGTVISCNPTAERLYGWAAHELRGRPLSAICPPELAGQHAVLAARIERGERIEEFETVRLRRDDTRLSVSLTVSPTRDADGRLSGSSEIVRDITKRKQAEHWLEAQHAVTRLLADPAALEGPLTPVLAALGERLGWTFGSLWEVDRRAQVLFCRATWTSDDADTHDFEALTQRAHFAPGEGTPGRVWITAAPVWVEQFADQRGCLRARAAADGGLRGAVGLPITSGDELLGVIELISRDRQPPEEGLTEVLATISAQIGQFLERRRAQEEHARNLAAVTATRELARSADPRSARTAICEVALKISDAYLTIFFEPDASGLGLVATAAAGGALPDIVRDEVLPYAAASGAVTAFKSRSRFFVADPLGHPEVSQRHLAATDAASMLLHPVVSDGESVGVLGVYWSRRMSTLDERLGSLIDLLAAEAAMAMERAAMLSRLERVARTDELTGLPNRRAWDRELSIVLELAERDLAPVCVAVLDLDRFKSFNDERGHQAGDRLLKQTAASWSEQLREPDVLARYGGEEFTVLLPAIPAEDAAAAIERLRTATPGGQTCSAGIAIWDGSETADTLVGRADAALYAAKELGRDRHVVHTPEIAELLADAASRRDSESVAALGTVIALAEALDLRDSRTARHSQTVACYAHEMARELELDPERADRVRIAALLHDVGKIGVADSILRKEGPLTDEEWAEMRRHPEIGARILATTSFDDIRTWVLAHHERPDGHGYPRALTSEEIPLEAKILAVADSYEAMTSDRVYRDALDDERACAELRRCAGGQFDERVVAAFLAVLERKGSVATRAGDQVS